MTITVYFIRTFDTEDEQGCTCSYDYRQFLEIKKMLKEDKTLFIEWKEKIEHCF